MENAGELIQFVPDKAGSPVGGAYVSKEQRIRGAVCDLELAIDGCAARYTDDPPRHSQVVAAFARACAMFLRKTVIDKETRILDVETCKEFSITFGRIRKIPADRRTLTLIPFDVKEGQMILEKLVDGRAEEVEATQTVSMRSQRLEFHVDWPLPGMAGWTRQPTPADPWSVFPDELFDDPPRRPSDDCNTWLGQQLVIFDQRPISLHDLLKVTADTEAAHSVNVSRLLQVEGERDRRVVANRNIHILSNLTVCGIQYNHVIVIEAAMHVVHMLHRAGLAGEPGDGVGIPRFCYIPDDTDVFGSNQTWLRFGGSLMLAFGETPRIISHHVGAPGSR